MLENIEITLRQCVYFSFLFLCDSIFLYFHVEQYSALTLCCQYVTNFACRDYYGHLFTPKDLQLHTRCSNRLRQSKALVGWEWGRYPLPSQLEVWGAS